MPPQYKKRHGAPRGRLRCRQDSKSFWLEFRGIWVGHVKNVPLRTGRVSGARGKGVVTRALITGGLLAKVTGHEVVAAGSEEAEVPDEIAKDSGLLTGAAA